LSVTKRVCGIGPSTASTSSSTPSTMPSTRSTSPPKSAWPGVSTMLMARPRATDRAVLREDRDPALALDVVGVHHPLADVLVLANVPACTSSLSTSVVFPWSTWAMIAMLRRIRDVAAWRRCGVAEGSGTPAAPMPKNYRL
jgi:hypothetical protein